MVHVLRRTGQALRPGGVLVSIQPHRSKRLSISITARSLRVPVAALVNPPFERYLSAAEASLRRVVLDRWFTLIGRTSYDYRTRLANLSELDRYLDLLSPRPPFPPGGRRRLNALWASRLPGARIQVTESMVLIALRVTSTAHNARR